LFEGFLVDFFFLFFEEVDLAVHRLVQKIFLVDDVQGFQSVADYFGVGGCQMVLTVFETFGQLSNFVVMDYFQILEWLFYPFAIIYIFE
jgi:hypothetical protein